MDLRGGSRDSQRGDPIHRPATSIKKSTKIKKLTIKSDWYRTKSKGESDIRLKSWGKRKIPAKGGMGGGRDPPLHPFLSLGHLGGPCVKS